MTAHFKLIKSVSATDPKVFRVDIYLADAPLVTSYQLEIQVSGMAAGITYSYQALEVAGMSVVTDAGVSSIGGFSMDGVTFDATGLLIGVATIAFAQQPAAPFKLSLSQVELYNTANESVSFVVDNAATGSLLVTGLAAEGGELLASLANLSDADGATTTAWQWQVSDNGSVGWTNLANATANRYGIAVDQSQVGKYLRVLAITTDVLNGTTAFTGQSSTQVVNVDDPATGTLSTLGTASEGGALAATLTNIVDLDGAVNAVAWQWQVSGNGTGAWTDLAEATAANYAIASDQSLVGKYLRVVSTTYDVLGGSTRFDGQASVQIANVDDAATGVLAVVGAAAEGGSMTASLTSVADADGATTTAWQWQISSTGIGNWSNLSGAVAATYGIAADQSQVGKYLRAVATTTDVLGGTTTFSGLSSAQIANVDDAATGTLAVLGVAAEGGGLAASLTNLVDADGATTTAWQWQISSSGTGGWSNLSGADAARCDFAADQSQVGKYVRVVATTSDVLGGTTSFTGVASAPIANVNDLPGGSVTIGGTAVQGQTLTAGNNLTDADGLGAISYQWKADGADISGATGSSFLLTAAQVGKAIAVAASYTDGYGTPEAVLSASVIAMAAKLDGIVYQWKSHMLLDGVSVSAVGGGQPVEGSSAPLQFKNMTWDATGHASVDVYAHAALAFQNASLELGLGSSTGVVFTVDAALPSDWSMLSNIDPANGHLLVEGFGLSSAIAAGDVKLGTVTFETGALDHATVQLVSGAVGDAVASRYGLAVARDITDAQGGFTLSDLALGVNAISATRATSDSGSAITSADALAALRIAVGLNPNPDPDGTGPLTALPVSPYQFIAADVVGTDGRITSADALAILRMAVKLPTAPAKEWLFVEETRDFWDEATGKFTLDRTHASWDHAISANVQSDQAMNLVGVLKGDVNGSWAAPTGSVDLDVISPQYFTALHDQLGLPAAQFGVYP